MSPSSVSVDRCACASLKRQALDVCVKYFSDMAHNNLTLISFYYLLYHVIAVVVAPTRDCSSVVEYLDW